MITKFIKRILRRDPMIRHTAAHTSGAPKRVPKKLTALTQIYFLKML
jgi:poly(A) polymerase